MTPQEINIAIAPLLGWEFKRGARMHRGRKNSWEQDLCRHPYHTSGIWRPIGKLSNYYHDLNACAEMEKNLTTLEQISYSAALEDECSFEKGNYLPFSCLTSTAPQRCEAFLRVKGIWKGGE